MSKINEKIINNIKMLSLDMIYKARSGDAGIVFSAVNVFYSLFMDHLIFDPNDISFINKDRLLVSNRLLPLFYSCNYLFYKDMPLDDLKDYKTFKSNITGNNRMSKLNPISSLINSDIVSSSVGVSLGREYLNGLLTIEDSKNKLVNFKTYCIITLDELMSGIAYEAMSFASIQNLNNLIFIVIKDEVGKDSSNKETFNEDLIDRFIALNYNVEEINDNLNSIDGALIDAKNSKKPSIIIVKSIYGKSSKIENSNKLYNKPLSEEEMTELRSKYGLANPFDVSLEVIKEIRKNISKRLSKYLINYQTLKQEGMKDLKIKEIIDFLTNKKVNVEINPANIKINESYEEELVKSNSKILNLIANKSPFIICASDDNFLYTLASIKKSGIMSKENRTGRNILFGNRVLAMGGVCYGLASLGFKVFVSTPLINESFLKNTLRLSTLTNVDLNFIFTQDSFTNSYLDNEFFASSEINDLRSIHNLVLYRPCDIKEIIGVYSTICKLNKPSALVIGSEVVNVLKGTHEKYVLAGAYRVKKESDDLVDAIIVATGSEVSLATNIIEELKQYDLNIRLVSLVSSTLFELQSEKYQNMLLPKDIKTFTLEFGNPTYLEKYATSKDYALGVNEFFVGGTKEEKLNYYHLNKDAIKAKIIDLLKK